MRILIKNGLQTAGQNASLSSNFIDISCNRILWQNGAFLKGRFVHNQNFPLFFYFLKIIADMSSYLDLN